jgi:molybdopterin synthase sulfur carrier subunit
MPRLKFFGSFRSYVSSREIALAAGSVREAFDQVWADNPKLRAAMLENEALRPYVRVLVNGRHVGLAQGLDTPLAPEDEVAIFSPVAGG